MSNINNKSGDVSPTSKPQEQFFPPPPPGPPPVQTAQAPVAQHLNETPIRDYAIPQYRPSNPSHPTGEPVDDIYDATPTDEHPPQFPPAGSAQQQYEGKSSKPGWSSKLSGWGSKAAGPFNALANKMGSETFFPGPLDKECEKAARILRSFCSMSTLLPSHCWSTYFPPENRVLTDSLQRTASTTTQPLILPQLRPPSPQIPPHPPSPMTHTPQSTASPSIPKLARSRESF